jgi:hypothetical protein
MRWFLVLLLLIPAPVRALEICDDLWFTRNLLFSRGGYCFNSVLGQAVFGNEGCQPGAIELGPMGKDLVARVRALEVEYDCNIDTGQDILEVPQIALRQSIVDIPLVTGSESSCIGWRGGRLPLHTERQADALLTGAARDGDTLLFQFRDVDGWSFVEVYQQDIPVGAGWAKVAIDDKVCTAVAG